MDDWREIARQIAEELTRDVEERREYIRRQRYMPEEDVFAGYSELCRLRSLFYHYARNDLFLSAEDRDQVERAIIARLRCDTTVR